ncbi:MAG: hypothetical protein ABI969_07660 [bacterium]
MCSAHVARAQSSAPLPPTRADTLLADGRWMEAEAAYYQQSERAPRDPVARAALGRFIAMKGAVRPGLVLIAEARKFGLDKSVTRELVTPLSAIIQWRDEAATFKRDTTLSARAPNDQRALFQVALPRTDASGRPQAAQSGVSEVSWHDVVDWQIGLDSINAKNRPIGIEVFEALAPSMNVRTGDITLHANTRSALSTTGRRYQVLRTELGVRVLVGDQRVLPLADAIRELATSWWQLDLPHGLLVVR